MSVEEYEIFEFLKSFFGDAKTLLEDLRFWKLFVDTFSWENENILYFRKLPLGTKRFWLNILATKLEELSTEPIKTTDSDYLLVNLSYAYAHLEEDILRVVNTLSDVLRSSVVQESPDLSYCLSEALKIVSRDKAALEILSKTLKEDVVVASCLAISYLR